MMNYIFAFMVIISVILSCFLGRTSELTAAVLEGGYAAVLFCLELCGSVALWSGVMKIAERSGLCDKISAALSPITGFLFKGLREQSPKAINAISMNITANILGLGSAATPMALEAMVEMDRLNNFSKKASDYMVVFVALNTASIQLLPTTVATIRKMAGSPSPLDIVPAVWVTSIVCVTVVVGVAMILRRPRSRRRGGKRE